MMSSILWMSGQLCAGSPEVASCIKDSESVSHEAGASLRKRPNR